jgi:hypothetical protein
MPSLMRAMARAKLLASIETSVVTVPVGGHGLLDLEEVQGHKRYSLPQDLGTTWIWIGLMGVFGTNLYSGDFATDLRAAVRAVLRLPFDPDRLVDILSGVEPSAADNPDNEDHTTFWLVVADQFAKHGVACDRVRTKALALIATGTDIAMLERLGMKAPDLHRRRRILNDLRTRIAAGPSTSKPRTVLRKPQPFLMEIGDVLVYPTCGGKNINPYFRSKEANIHHGKQGPGLWKQDGWGALVVLDCGRVFDFLSWYRPATLAEACGEKPTLDSLRGTMLWRVELPGTCSPLHFKKMELEKIGVLPIDREKANGVYPKRFGSGLSVAVQDISIANRMKAAHPGNAIPNPGGEQKCYTPTLSGIEQVLL